MKATDIKHQNYQLGNAKNIQLSHIDNNVLYQDAATQKLNFINYGEPSPRSIQIQFENADQC